MKATIQNFMGISEAHIEISPIALITGHNYAGKTSIARAIAAAATGKAIPYDKIAKKDCGVILRHGSKAGSVVLETEEGNTSVAWPKAEVSSEGRPPVASAIAAGLTDLLSMPHKEAMDYVINLLKADVRKDDFVASLVDAGVSAPAADKVWLTVDAQGWDAALARAKETGSRLKGAWEAVTREKFGSKKAAEWLPQEWEDGLQNQKLESLDAAVTSARKQLEIAIAKGAVNSAEIANVKAQADALPTLEAQKKDAEGSVASILAEQQKVEQKLRNTPNPNAKHDYSCPHCEGKINISTVSGKHVVTKAASISDADLKAARIAYAEISGDQENVAQRLSSARAKVAGIASDIAAAQRAQEKLAKLGSVTATSQEEDTLAADRAALAKAEMRAQCFKMFTESHRAAAQIADNQVIIDLLDETGLRRTKLAQSLTAFQESFLAPICLSFGMPEVEMGADLDIALSGTPFAMLSASEQFRVKTVLQLAIAQLEKASLVIIDGADILDQGGRGKLLQAVLKVGIPAIICMTLAKPEAAPNLAAVGAGVTYWIEGNTCRPVQILKPVAQSAISTPARAESEPVPSGKGFMQKLQEKREGAAA